MRATRKAILTDARNGLLGNGYAQGMGQILDARNLHPAGNPSNQKMHFVNHAINRLDLRLAILRKIFRGSGLAHTNKTSLNTECRIQST